MNTETLKIAVCHSDDIDTNDAMLELLEQAEEELNGSVPQAGILFAAIDYEHQIFLTGITEKWPGIQLVGGTTDGEISSRMDFKEDSVVLMLFCSNTYEFSAGLGNIQGASIETACKTAVESASEGISAEVNLCITFPGNTTTNADQIIFNLNKFLHEEVMIFGGIPGDQWRFKTQYQFFGNEVHTDAVPILLISGDLQFVYGVDSGWKPMGNEGIVTKSEGNIIYKINNETAHSFYKNSLGELNTPSAEFPLIVLNDDNHVQYQRAPAAVLEDGSGGVVLMGEIPEGAKVKICSADRVDILNGTSKSIISALDRVPENAEISGALLISCAARKSLLGTKTKEECKLVSEKLGADIPFAGFYSYGELSPVKHKGKKAMLHNQTFVTVLFLSNRDTPH